MEALASVPDRSSMLPYHDVRLTRASANIVRDQAWLGIVRALLNPGSTPMDLVRAIDAHAPYDLDRWWTDAPFQNPQADGLEILARPGVERWHDARSLLAIAVMSPHPWAWPELIGHWNSTYATDGKRSPHLDWIRPAICQAQVHQASPETMAWWLDHHPGFNPSDRTTAMQAQANRDHLARAWWRGLTHWLRTGRSDNSVLAGDLPAQDVWGVFDVLHARDLAQVEEWSQLRNLAALVNTSGPTPNAQADTSRPLVTTPIEAVIELRGSEPVLERWLAQGGDPNLTNPYSGVSLVHRAIQCTIPTNLQQLLDAGATLDVAAGSWEESGEHGRRAGVLGYPWCHLTERFPTRAIVDTVPPPSPWWEDHAFPGPRALRRARVETQLGLAPVLRWCAQHHTALRLGEEVGVNDVWNAGAWQAWLDGRELRDTLAQEAPVAPALQRRRL